MIWSRCLISSDFFELIHFLLICMTITSHMSSCKLWELNNIYSLCLFVCLWLQAQDMLPLSFISNDQDFNLDEELHYVLILFVTINLSPGCFSFGASLFSVFGILNSTQALLSLSICHLPAISTELMEQLKVWREKNRVQKWVKTIIEVRKSKCLVLW